MTLKEYIQEKRKEYEGKKIPSSIANRWDERVVGQGFDQKGATGVKEYLEKYGRGIKAPKCVHFALHAETEGHNDMAQVFWVKAFELETA